MVVMALVVVRSTMHLENLITMYHLEVMNKVILTCSCLMGYAYLMEGIYGLVQHEPVHSPHFHAVHRRDLLVGRLADDHLQYPHSAASLGAPVPPELPRR